MKAPQKSLMNWESKSGELKVVNLVLRLASAISLLRLLMLLAL